MLPSFSPDGRWLAFSSNSTGGSEIYVMDFPGGLQRVRVSADGGLKPRWRRDGKELFYLAVDGSMMVAKMAVVSGQMIAEPTRLFNANLKIHTNYDANYAVTSDGQRFLGIAREGPSSDVDIQMVLNWPSLLRSRCCSRDSGKLVRRQFDHSARVNNDKSASACRCALVQVDRITGYPETLEHGRRVRRSAGGQLLQDGDCTDSGSSLVNECIGDLSLVVRDRQEQQPTLCLLPS